MTEQMIEHLTLLTKQKHYRKDNRYGYETGRSPFIDYILEDKESYKPLSSSICRFTGKPWIDRDNDFLIGESGGVLMKIDFVFVDTEIFSRVADFYEKHGCYCLEPDDSPNAVKFWQREMDRRVKGVQAYCKLYINDIPAYLAAKSDAERKALLHKVRITGDHYNYLNYGRIERAPNEKERKQLDKEGRFKVNTVEGFPRFWDGDYWNFKIDELIANNSCNLCKAKARRKGFSYKRGSQAANTINANKNVTVTLAADQMDYLTEKGATSYMVKVNLDWYEDKTYWRRGYLSENFDKGIELGYKKSKEGQKAFGFRSKLLSVAIGKNESAAVGKKAIETDFEEAGKCFGENTGFIMSDGQIKFVQDIKVGDKLMGPDGNPRTVLATINGEDDLYEVTPLNGESHVVNSKHDIYMIYRKSDGNICKPITMTAPDYINMIKEHPRWKDNHALIKTCIDFDKKNVKIEPYVFGLWIGDGDKDTCRFTNEDSEVIDYLKEYSKNNNLDYSIADTNSNAKRITLVKCEDASDNWFRQELFNMGVLHNKYIPKEYIYTDKQSRLEFLAGIIDTDGSYDSKKHNFEIAQKDPAIVYDIVYICRSLGLKTTVSEKIIRGVTYYRIFILSGCHLIPTKINRKKAENYISLQKNVLETRFDIKPIGRGRYYGFEVDSDNLVLLEDFTITHNCPNLQKALDVMMSNSESGAMRIGTIRVYGTGGTKGANWEAFSNCFYNPGKNDMLPMENIWDANSRHAVCGFFFPQIWDYEPFIEDGNSLLFASWKDDYDKKRGAEKEKDAGEYNIYVGQRANSPNEAFTNTQENIFHSPELTNHINAIKYDKSNHFYEDGWYILDAGRVRFVTKQECIERAIFGSDRFHEYITDVPHNSKTDVHGCIREFYSPIPNDGSLYFISYDPYRVDKNKEEVSTKNSLASFQVWMRTNSKTPYMGKRLVASYCGRLDTMEAVDKLVLYACLRWNCKVLYEAGTGELVTNFKKWGYRDKLLKDPSSYINRSVDGPRITGYGIVIGDGDIKLEGMRMVRDFLYEIVGKTSDDTPIYRFNQIYDISFLLELDRFIFGRNADRLSSAIVAMFEFRKDSLLLEREANSKSKTNNTGRKVNRFLK